MEKEVIDAEFDEEKPVIEEIAESLDSASKVFENRIPDLSEALKEAAIKAREFKEDAKKLGEDIKEAKRLSVKLKELFEKINDFRGEHFIRRDF